MENLYKYPRTYHFDFSQAISSDDKVIKDLSPLDGEDIVVSIKMDGENTSVYSNNFHARSLDSNNHPSRNYVKGYWANKQYLIPEKWRICGENLYARHSIEYNDLESYFYCFNIWDGNNKCLSYDETLEWCTLLDIVHVPVLYIGKFDYNKIKSIYESIDFTKNEGIVVRKYNTL